ncbi:biotin--[acetyl-CoA-carboxylase] ligase [Chloroflexota bacterium]
MYQLDLEAYLENLSLGGIRFFPKTSSTNDEASGWVDTGCPDLALVVADEQTAGRGHGGHKWYTPAGTALAFSVVLRADEQIYQLLDFQNTARLNGLGALAVCQVIQKKYQQPAKIKWPNDILVNGKKLAGVLTEAQWIGDELVAVILGIGINVATQSIPPADWDTVNPRPFPATSMESVLGAHMSRWDLLYAVLEELLIWRGKLASPDFLDIWQQNLAFQDEWVQVFSPGMDEPLMVGRIIGLEKDGALRIQQKSGALSRLQHGEIYQADPRFGGFSLRPVDS